MKARNWIWVGGTLTLVVLCWDWIALLFGMFWFWLLCPDFNALSTACGPYTERFVLNRLYTVVCVVWISFLAITTWRRLRRAQKEKA